MRVEEKALSDAFGEQYLEYSRKTKRLIPKLF
jgi:protein-S-isoprenylcysteine O-methyltransferase Ste14